MPAGHGRARSLAALGLAANGAVPTIFLAGMPAQLRAADRGVLRATAGVDIAAEMDRPVYVVKKVAQRGNDVGHGGARLSPEGMRQDVTAMMLGLLLCLGLQLGLFGGELVKLESQATVGSNRLVGYGHGLFVAARLLIAAGQASLFGKGLDVIDVHEPSPVGGPGGNGDHALIA